MPTSIRIFLRACGQWSANGDSRLGAALAYYAVFSIAPLLIISIHIAGFIFGEDAARGQVEEQLSSLIGTDSATAVQSLIEAAARPRTDSWAALVSFGVLIVGALGIFLHVRNALCTIWRLEPPRGNTILGFLLDYLLALAMVFCTGLLLLVSLAASMIVPILRKYMDERFPDNGIPWQLLELGISMVYLTLLFTMLFRILSGRRIAWRYAIYGAAITSLLFSVGKIALGMYLVYTGTASMYGAFGSLVVFLVWVYYSSQILFLGAELVQARRTRHEWMGENDKVAGRQGDKETGRQGDKESN